MSMKIFRRSVDIAYALFDKEHDSRCFVCSCVFYKNKIISIGINTNKTHTITHKYNPLICRQTHEVVYKKGSCAEFNALRKVQNKTNIPFHKLTLVNVRVTKEGKFGLSRPCSSCSSLNRYMNLKDIYYTNDKGEFEKY